VALVPLFVAVYRSTPRRAGALGFVAGCVHFGMLVWWARYFGAVAVAPFVVILSLPWAAACAVIATCRRQGLRSAPLVGAIWIVGEGIIARWPLGGFSWGEIGYAAHDLAALRTLASLGGVALVSGVLVVGNAALAGVIVGERRVRSLVLLALLPMLTIGWWLVAPSTTRSGTLRVALVQGNDLDRDLTDAEMLAFTLPRKHFELARTIRGPVDLVVFPESAFHPEQIDDPRITTELQATARRLHTWVLANGLHDVEGGARVLNRNVLYDPSGTLRATYDKRHLVPFGEWVPWRTTLQRWISALERIPRDFRPGTSSPLMTIAGHRVATIICFESAFGHEVRPVVADGAELIVVSTNNRSYRRSANSEQHVGLGQLRAAETGRALVQAAVSGHSAVIEPDGSLRRETPLFENGVLTASVPLRTGQTFYVRMGDWVFWSGLAATVVAFAAASRRSRRARTRTLEPMSSEPAA
jgi:apolipoprotein N-acyltransferase